jgi:hypothetical protein
MPNPDQYPQRSLATLEREAHLSISSLLMTIARQTLRIDLLEEELSNVKAVVSRLNRRPTPPELKHGHHKSIKEKTPE